MNPEKYQTKNESLLNLFFFLIVYFCTQDFVGAFLYTNFNLPKIFFYFHLFLGEIILFSLFFYIITGSGFKIHKNLFFLLVFSIIVILYYGALSSDRFSFATLKDLRTLLLPVVLVYLAYYLINTEQKRRKFFYFFIFLSFGLTLWGIFETLFLPNQFWFNHVNISLYLNQIKGYDVNYPELGIDGSAMGREGYREFLPRRLTSTFGDPFGYAIGMPIGIIVFLYLFLKEKKIGYLLGLLMTSSALLLTFTRSGYVFFIVVFFIFCLIVLNKKQKIFSVFLFILFSPLLYIVYNFLSNFISHTITELLTNSKHSRDFVSFYTFVIQSADHWAGVGVGLRHVIESGYTWLMTQVGGVGLILFLAFIFSCMPIIYRKTRQKEKSGEFVSLKCINAIALGVLIATLILMNFSRYPFAMTTYMINWIIVGIALGTPKNIIERYSM